MNSTKSGCWTCPVCKKNKTEYWIDAGKAIKELLDWLEGNNVIMEMLTDHEDTEKKDS